MTILYIGLALVVGAVIGYVFFYTTTKRFIGGAQKHADKILDDAHTHAQNLKIETEKITNEKLAEVRKLEERIFKREERLDDKEKNLEAEAEKLHVQADEIRAIKIRAEELVNERQRAIEKVANLSQDEAVNHIVSIAEKNHSEDILAKLHKLENEGAQRFEHRAKDILATVINRLAQNAIPEHLTTTLPIDDEVKGKIIGKEGRNIKAFERATGVELLIDETPGSVIISSFDPTRREIARRSLLNLIADGRIQPAKIEDEVKKVEKEIGAVMKQNAERAIYETGAYNLPTGVSELLGRLSFRTSYGQNVLEHSIETAHIAGMLAGEMGADVKIAKAAALVHDIGKALDHEIEGTHVKIGMKILERLGTDKKIIDAMKSHHDEFPHESVESVIVQVADQISGGRPGARRDSLENYLKRLEALEKISNSHAGVVQSYALSAGREIRVFVSPAQVTDIEAKKMARDIANSIENEVRYPGEIRVTVIRENRVTEFAR